MKNEDNEGHGHLIHYTVDGEPESTSEKELTPVQIMQSADIDPQTNYLELHDGHKVVSYKETPNESIKMKEGMHFVTKPIGPMPVS